MKKIQWLQNFEEIIAGVGIVLTTFIVLLNVFTRKVLNMPISWMDEVATGLFVWSVFLGASAAYKKHKHLGIDILVDFLSPRNRKMAQLIVDLVMAVILGVIVYLSLVYLKTSYTKVTPVLKISTAYISVSLAISFILMELRTIQFIVSDIKNIKRGA